TPGVPGDDFSPTPVDANNDGYNDGDTNHDHLLDVGEVWRYVKSLVANAEGQFTNISKVTGTPVDENGAAFGNDVTDTDPANYFVVATTPEQAEGRMTGGGSIFTAGGVRVTHGFELHCNPLIGPNNLEINWGNGNNFHLEQVIDCTCTETILDQENPAAP